MARMGGRGRQRCGHRLQRPQRSPTPRMAALSPDPLPISRPSCLFHPGKAELQNHQTRQASEHAAIRRAQRKPGKGGGGEGRQ